MFSDETSPRFLYVTFATMLNELMEFWLEEGQDLLLVVITVSLSFTHFRLSPFQFSLLLLTRKSGIEGGGGGGGLQF